MSSKKESERVKYIQEKCQTLLTQMLRDEDNKYCVDCDAKGPRWASWNLGVFLCIRCAGIHRNLGVHISRVKSVNLDSWTPEQVVSLEQMGNSRARAVYEAQLPDGFRRPQNDSALESFIRAKYEHKKYLAREWVPPPPPKVDWDKEIEEELERQKRKKKASSSNVGISSPAGDKKVNLVSVKTPLPAPLPKPKTNSSSPKSSRTDAHAASSDLLGLSSPTNSNGPSKVPSTLNDIGNDAFNSFLSASPLPEQKNPAASIVIEKNENSLAKEEADFFNQIPSEKEKAKMTKDSIMALYGNAPSNSNVGTFSNNIGGFNNFNNAPGGFMPQMPAQFALNSTAVNFGAAPPNFNNQFGQPNLQMGLGPLMGQSTVPISTPSFAAVGQPLPSMGAHLGMPGQQNGLMLNMSPLSGHPQQQQSQPHSSPFNSISAQQPIQSFAQFPPSTFPTQINNLVQAQPVKNTNLNQQFGNLNLGNVWQ